MKDGNDLYQNKRDKYYLIKDVMDVFNKCIEDTKVKNYGKNIAIDDDWFATISTIIFLLGFLSSN